MRRSLFTVFLVSVVLITSGAPNVAQASWWNPFSSDSPLNIGNIISNVGNAVINIIDFTVCVTQDVNLAIGIGNGCNGGYAGSNSGSSGSTVCTSSPNSCGQTNTGTLVNGVCVGSSFDRVDTRTLTPSGHYLGTADDFRDYATDAICQLAGKGPATGNYACYSGSPDLNTYTYGGDPDSGYSWSISAYYADSRHNGNWGYFVPGTGWCQDTGVEWVECSTAISAPSDSSCPVIPVPTPTPTPTPEPTPTPTPNPTPEPTPTPTPTPTPCTPPQTLVNGVCTTPPPPQPTSCPLGQAYVNDVCTACSNGGCTGGPATPPDPLGPPTSPLVCTNRATNPPDCALFEPPTTPTISALWQGTNYLGTTASAYDASGYQLLAQSTSPYGSNLDYYFEWQKPGDAATAQWSSWTGSGGWGSVTHYADYGPGTYYVRAAAYDDKNNSSTWSNWFPITLTLPPLSVSCSGTPGDAYVGQPITWTSSVSGGSGSTIYVWSGTDNLFDTTASVQKSYSSAGPKQASLSITDPKSGQTASATCTNGTSGGTNITIKSCVATLTATPSTVEQGDTTNLSWSVSDGPLCASSCASSDFVTGGATTGTADAAVPPTPPSTSYTLACSGGTYGPPPPANATVTVIIPDVNITVNGQAPSAGAGGANTMANAPRVNPTIPNNVTIAWSLPADNTTSVKCSVTKNGVLVPKWTGVSSPPGGFPDSVKVQTTYIITCENKKGAKVTKSVFVNILSAYGEF